MSKKTETELKFKLTKIPDSLKDPSIIKQFYLKFNNQGIKDKVQEYFPGILIEWGNVVELRVRAEVTRATKSYSITLKSDGTVDRVEYSSAIAEDGYNYFSKFPYIGMIMKLRYRLTVLGTDLTVDVDNYIGGLYGLYLAEIEFDRGKYTEEQVREVAEEHFGQDIVDVTADSKYKNRNLAILNNIVQNKKEN
jgi:CYTH domain-containing protein